MQTPPTLLFVTALLLLGLPAPAGADPSRAVAGDSRVDSLVASLEADSETPGGRLLDAAELCRVADRLHADMTRGMERGLEAQLAALQADPIELALASRSATSLPPPASPAVADQGTMRCSFRPGGTMECVLQAERAGVLSISRVD